MCFPSYSLSLIACSMLNGWGRPGPFYHVTQCLQWSPIESTHFEHTFFILTLCFCILQPIKNWTMGRPGNEASGCNKFMYAIPVQSVNIVSDSSM